jgi:hypothetical protein
LAAAKYSEPCRRRNADGGGGENNNLKGDYGDGNMRAVHGWHRVAYGEGKVWYAGMDGMYTGFGHWSTACWSFDRTSLLWTYYGLGMPTISGGNFDGQAGCGVYDPVTRKVWSFNTGGNGAGVGTYSVDAQSGLIERYTLTLGSGAPRWATAGLGLIFIGMPNLGQIAVFNPSNPGAGFTIRTVSGTFPSDNHGCVFHAPSRAMFFWHGLGASIRKIAIPAEPVHWSLCFDTSGPGRREFSDPSDPAEPRHLREVQYH